MRRFILHTLATLVLAALLLELILRIFHFSAHVLPEANVDGDRMLKPGIEGYWSAGGMGEFRGHYRVNAQGWNSTVDYDQPDSGKIRVAIIGDSYIEGLHFDVEQSVGRILESKSPQFQVHEYGRSGANIMDYLQVHEKYTRDRYDYIFVLVSNDDLMGTVPFYMGKGDELKSPSKAKKLYYASHLLCYIGLNHGMGVRIRERLNDSAGKIHAGPTSVVQIAKINHAAVKKLQNEVVYLCDRDRIDPAIVEKYNCLVIDHRLQPADCGFAYHWNMNGRENCAQTINTYIHDRLQAH